MSHNYDDLVVITDQAQDYWRLDNNYDEGVNKAKNGIAVSTSGYGSTAEDLLPASNNLRSNYFDGTDDYATALQSSQFGTYTTKVTVEAWIRPDADQSATDVVGIATKPGCFGLYLAYGKPTFYTCLNGGDGTKRLVSSGTAVSTGTNYHLVGVYIDEDTTRYTKLYVNGSLVASDTTYSGTIVQNSANFSIGSWDTSVLFFQGWMSNVALYAYALSSTQISSHYGYTG